MKKSIVALLFLFWTGVSWAQTRSLTGRVVNALGNQAIESASVKVKGGGQASLTDESGKFSLIVPLGNIVLEISSVGFTPREVSVSASENDITITLSEGMAELDEVVVTALGIKRQRKSLGYAVQELKGSELVQTRETNLANALSGKVAGLQVVRSSNGAGGSSKIILRGNNSLTGTNQPLIVVDGIPIDNFTGTNENGYWGAGFDRGNGLGDISADDIESMSVLKGPSAAALYGNRAGNGVILITTKSGRKQQGLGITFSSTFGFENIFTNPKLQNTYGQGLDGVYDNRAATSWGPKAEGQSLPNWQNVNEPLRIYDNIDNFLRTGTNQNHTLSFQQQYGSTAIYSSISWLEDQSILPGNKLNRTNITTRALSRFGQGDRWTLDAKVQYNNTAGFNRPINGRDNSSVYVINMLPRSLDITSFSQATDNDGNMLWYGGSNQVNPYWRAMYDLNEDSRDRFIMNGSLKYAFTDWLDAEVKAGSDMYTTNTSRKIYAGSPQPRTGRYEMGKEVFTETNYSSMIHARKDNLVGRFGANATIGGNLMAQKYSSLRANSGELVVPNLFSLNNGVNNPTVGEGLGERRINSLFGTAGINYDGYLYFDATVRNDWSSTLSKTNRSFFYPSFSLSYVITEMLNTMGKSIPNWLSYAKLRGSYAEVGNDLPPYQLYNVYRIGKDPNGNTTASRDNILRDPNVRSELIKSMEFGAEMRFIKNRVGIDFSWYKSNATRQLLDIPLDPMSGYSAMKINAGDIQNEGIEIIFDARILNQPNSVNWTMIANYSQNRNKIVELASDLGVTEYTLGGFDDLFIRAVIGSMYGDIYGTRFRRVEDQSSPHFGQLLLNGDGLPVRDPKIVKLGNQQPRGMLGITNNFNYKGVSLSFLIDARFGGEIFSASQVGLQSSGNAAVTAPGGTRTDRVVDGVILDASGNTVKNSKAVSQQLYWSAVSTANNLGVGEAYLYDATNVRLRNVQISYDLPRSFIGRTSLQNARISASCNNVWMIKSYMDGIDPESVFATGSNAVGFENGAPPTMRSFLFSLTLGF